MVCALSPLGYSLKYFEYSPIKCLTSITKPVSSKVSLIAASSADYPSSRAPPGNPHISFSLSLF